MDRNKPGAIFFAACRCQRAEVWVVLVVQQYMHHTADFSVLCKHWIYIAIHRPVR
jgi:hypothetical protein